MFSIKWNGKENENSYGLSGQTIADFSKNLETNLTLISSELKKRTYKFSPTRAAVIKKDNGKYRPLQIPEIRDRVVLKAMAILLEDNLSPILARSDGVSFAYQKGIGVRDAVLRMKELYLQRGTVILKADIINFFEEVQKNKLLEELIFPNLIDDSINHLIQASLSQKLGGLKKLSKELKQLFKNAGKGIPQGNPLSPLLSNIYLSNFDSFMKEKGYSSVRYADDFIVVFKSQVDATNGYKIIRKYLEDNHALNIHPIDTPNGKTEIVNPCEKEFSFLSIRFDGKNVYPSKDTIGVLKSRIKASIKSGELNSILFEEIYETIKKWMAPYSYLDIERYFDEIDSYLLAKLTKKFGKRNYKTTKCKSLVQKVRTKQYNKSSNSFWRNVDLFNILPRFIRGQLKR